MSQEQVPGLGCQVSGNMIPGDSDLLLPCSSLRYSTSIVVTLSAGSVIVSEPLTGICCTSTG